ncbi:BnaCnng61110D [Brassica napus]|uniref:BnaCnng61110D protein n=1 Tax=Brassica napus TaxID=3708 RepID=A0A078JTG9_BRANA|nr:BnaCnng61110D [Brassica napus]
MSRFLFFLVENLDNLVGLVLILSFLYVFTYGSSLEGLSKSMVDEACKLYKAMIDYGLSPSEVTRVTLAYGIVRGMI